MQKASLAFVGILLMLCMSMGALAITVPMTLNAPANASTLGEGVTSVILNVSINNTNTGAANNLTNISFFAGNGSLLGRVLNVIPTGSASMNWSNVTGVATYTWYAEATSGNGTGNTTLNTFTTTANDQCLANSSGATRIVLGAVAIFLALAIAFLFMDGNLLSIEFLVSAIVAAAFVLPFIGIIC